MGPKVLGEMCKEMQDELQDCLNIIDYPSNGEELDDAWKEKILKAYTILCTNYY